MYRTQGGNTDTLVFFCHLGITFAIMAHLIGLSPVMLWQGFFVAPTSVTTLVSEERIIRRALPSFSTKYGRTGSDPRQKVDGIRLLRAGLREIPCGVSAEASGRSSNPMTLISSGTFSPRLVSSAITPDAIRSLAQRIAVAPFSRKHFY